jgi:hypothetical protein
VNAGSWHASTIDFNRTWHGVLGAGNEARIVPATNDLYGINFAPQPSRQITIRKVCTIQGRISQPPMAATQASVKSLTKSRQPAMLEFCRVSDNRATSLLHAPSNQVIGHASNYIEVQRAETEAGPLKVSLWVTIKPVERWLDYYGCQ